MTAPLHARAARLTTLSRLSPGRVSCMCIMMTVGGEPACAAGPELADGRAALQGNAQVEQPLVGQSEQQVVLSDIDESRAPSATSALVVPDDVALGDHRAPISRPVESMTSKAPEWRPGRSRGPK